MEVGRGQGSVQISVSLTLLWAHVVNVVCTLPKLLVGQQRIFISYGKIELHRNVSKTLPTETPEPSSKHRLLSNQSFETERRLPPVCHTSSVSCHQCVTPAVWQLLLLLSVQNPLNKGGGSYLIPALESGKIRSSRLASIT